jgi:2,3-bisphosphoglycerate-independent phosphoglycerate mutase
MAAVGREGAVGISVLLGGDTAISRHVVQVPGSARVMEAALFRHALQQSQTLRSLANAYTQAFIAHILQSVACNGVHTVEERCTRWLLMTHDRSAGDTFVLTQEHLAQMLGVHRPTVSIAARALQRAGLIRYSRGVLTVLDRPGLAMASCECYRVIRDHFERLLDGHKPLIGVAPLHVSSASLVGLDATLGVPGTPQSGTGQAALLTGENAPRLFGRHFGPWTPTALRSLLARRNLLSRALAAGLDVAFANAYPAELISTLEDAPTPDARLGRSRRRGLPRAGPSLAALAAGLLDRHAEHLARGEAVASEITNETWRQRLGRLDLPAITPEQAGQNLARIVAANGLTLFAHYNLDYLGHRGAFPDAVNGIERVDAFLGAVCEAVPSDTLVLVASDHGNIEDVRVGHTQNPALALVAGPGHREVAGGLQSLLDVVPAIMHYLGG